MKKLVSLIKVSLNHDMNIFKIHTKKQSNFSKYLLPIILTIYIMFVFGMYATKMIEILKPIHLEYVVLTLFAFSLSLVTFIEGVYKSGTILFNCRDDQLLFSLPINKRTILFIRILKFYIFEFLYNSLFLLPALIIYAINVSPNWTYYIVSFLALLILPIIPVALSSLFGFLIMFLSSKFKGKNLFQTVFTILTLLAIFYISYNLEGFINNLANNATNINDYIIRLYYPVRIYISLIQSFDIRLFILYIFSHIIIMFITIYILGIVYFKINSQVKRVLKGNKNHHYEIKSNKKIVSFVKKELNRFYRTPVFITNAGFGLVLFIIACIGVSIKYNDFLPIISNVYPEMSLQQINLNLPVLMFGLVSFASLMTSITSSMISLESKSFNILKSLPLKSYEIVLYKVITALVIMLPCILIGDIIIFIRFKFDLISIILILITSILLPFVSELIGIIVNLKYPKLDATNDTEIVKQSMSSMISVFIGMGLLGMTIFLLFQLLELGLSSYLIILLFVLIYAIIAIGLWSLLLKKCDNLFNNINS